MDIHILYFIYSYMNREELNVLYSRVNELIDEYLDKWKINPIKLKTYLKKGTDRYDKFKKRNNLENVERIDKIIFDVIEDRCSTPMLFESVRNFDSLLDCVINGLERPDINAEKELSIIFDVNVGDIDIEDSKRHIFSIDNWDTKFNVVILSLDEFELIRLNLRDFLYNRLSNTSITIPNALKIDLSGLIDIESYKNRSDEFIDEKFTIKIIEDQFNCKLNKKTNSYYIFDLKM